MVVIPNISERTFYIIIAAIAVVGLIFILIQIRRIKKAQKKVNYLGDELKLKKLELVKGDMRSACQKKEKMDKPIYSPNFGGKHYKNLLRDVDESKRSLEFMKIEKKLSDLDKREEVFDRRKQKFEMDDNDFKRKISKYDREC
ncbi:MAG: hypothetical protein F8N15_08980 [Methanobacterium sp.]|nr:hypothetical protein [Methanobacterium sp.]